MINIAICDDNVDEIKQYEDYMDEQPANTFTYDVFYDSYELLEYQKLTGCKYHLYFLDIEMEEMDGLSLAREIRRFDQRALIIFVTNHAQYVYDVFDVITFHFLQKPITSSDFQYILHRALNYFKLTQRNFVFKQQRNIVTVPCDDIYFIEKDDRKAYIYTTNETYDCYMSMNKILPQLGETFARIHGSVIVNLKYVKSIKDNEVLLTSGTKLYCSRSYNKNAKRKHLDFLRNLI